MFSLESATPAAAIDFAMQEGRGHFRALIRLKGAASQLGCEEEDVLNDFAVFLAEKKAAPVFAYRSKQGARFSTYITVVFRNWLSRRLQSREVRSAALSVDPGSLEWLADSAYGESRVILDLRACLAALDEKSKLLMSQVLDGGQKLADVARKGNLNPKTLYRTYYAILRKIRICLESRGVNAGDIHE